MVGPSAELRRLDELPTCSTERLGVNHAHSAHDPQCEVQPSVGVQPLHEPVRRVYACSGKCEPWWALRTITMRGAALLTEMLLLLLLLLLLWLWLLTLVRHGGGDGSLLMVSATHARSRAPTSTLQHECSVSSVDVGR
jgi:hypothetical protein